MADKMKLEMALDKIEEHLNLAVEGLEVVEKALNEPSIRYYITNHIKAILKYSPVCSPTLPSIRDEVAKLLDDFKLSGPKGIKLDEYVEDEN